MQRLVLAMLVLVALAGSLWLWLGRGPTTMAPAAGPAPADAADGGTLPLAADEPSAPEREEVAAVEPSAGPSVEPTAAPAVLAVDVRLREDDAPVADVEVLVRAESEGERLDLIGRSDAAGRCRLEHTTAFVAQTVTVRPTPTTSGEARWLDRTWVGAGATVPVKMLVSEGGTLVGLVVDGEGRPVAGARVLGWCSTRYPPQRSPDRETLSDEQGRFEIAHLGADFRLVAEKEGLACSEGLQGKLAPGARAEGELVLVLQHLRTVRGRVLGERDQPLRARLKIAAHLFGGSSDATGVIGVERWRPVQAEAVCDEQGAFELGPVPRGRWNVEIEAPEHLLVRMRVPDEDGEWIVRLQAGCGVQGVVLDAAGEPLEGAEVALHGGPGGEERLVHRAGEPQVLYGSWRETLSTPDGGFAVGGVACGEGAILRVSAPGHAPWLREGLDLRLGAAQRLDVHLEPGLPLAGRVVETNGTPVAGAKLQLEGDRTYTRDYSSSVPATWEHLFGRGNTTSDAQGRFRFEDLYAGRFEVHVRVPGGVELHVDEVGFAGDEALEIVVDRAALERVVLEGRVTDRRTGEPLRSFTVVPMVHEGTGATGRGTTVNDEDGRFRVAGLDPGRIEVTVKAPGYAQWRAEPRQLEVGVHRFEVGLVALRSIELRVLKPDGEVCEMSGSLHFRRPTGEEVRVQTNMGSTDRVWLREGVAKGVGLPAELLQVTLQRSDGWTEQVFDLDLERDSSDVFELLLEHLPGDASTAQSTVQSLLYSVAEDYDVSDLEARTMANQAPLAEPGCGAPGVAVVVHVRDASGGKLVTGTLEPAGEGFHLTWRWPGSTRTSESTLPVSALDARIPAAAATLTLEAAGHDPLTLQLDPTVENAGVPLILVLLRK